MIAAAVGYHPYRDVLHRFQHPRRVAVLFGAEIAHNANNGAVLVNIYRTESAQLALYLIQVGDIINC